MVTPVTVETIDDGATSLVSWSAVIAGGIAAAAVTLLLLAFGIGVGFSVVSPWAGEGVSSTTLHVGAGIYLIVVAMLASTVGGLIAGRMRARWIGAHRDEVFFRDTAHGFLAWAFATVLTAAALGGATTHILAGASAGLIPAAGAATATAVNPSDIYVDALLRTDPPPNVAAANAGGLAATRAELGRLFTVNQRNRTDLSSPDRAYVAKVVAARTGLSQADAERRVTEVSNQAQTAADEARKTAAKLSLWLAASMLAGAFAASLAATEGGAFRDERWYEPGWKRTATF
jgi:hypothetical protein